VHGASHVTTNIKLPDLPIANTVNKMAFGGGTLDVLALPTPEFCDFLHSPCWLYPMIRFFGHVIEGESPGPH